MILYEIIVVHSHRQEEMMNQINAKVKKLWPLLFLLFIPVILSGCNTKYTSKDGEVLLKYAEPEQLRELVENPKPDISIIDVRPESAYIKGHIPTALSYPSSGIQKMLDELSQDQYLIVYCETGGRAQGVISQLEENGYTKMMNWGGYTRWPWELETGK